MPDADLVAWSTANRERKAGTGILITQSGQSPAHIRTHGRVQTAGETRQQAASAHRGMVRVGWRGNVCRPGDDDVIS